MSRSEEFQGSRLESIGHPSLLHPNFTDEHFGSNLGWVPTHLMQKFQGNNLRYDPKNIISDLKEGRGLKEALHLDFDPKTRWARLAEGNHRLHAALATNTPYVPVVGWRNKNLSTSMGTHTGLSEEDVAPFIDKTGYFPGNFNPRLIFGSAVK